MKISTPHQQVLLSLARDVIQTALHSGRKTPVDPNLYPPELRTALSSFVTLHIDAKLRGCIGALEAREALVADVAQHAFAAAFNDPRFSPLSRVEFDKVYIEISVLSPQALIVCNSEEHLLASLREGEDGLTLEDGLYRGTFLPSVWQQLPDKQEFLRQLKRKAGMPDNYWSPTLRAFRYTTTCFSEPAR